MKFIGLLVTFLFAGMSLAAESSDSGKEFRLDKGLLNELYRQSVTDAKIETRSVKNSVVVTPQLSLMTASEFVLTNNYFSVPYGQSLGTTPGFFLSAETALAHFSGFELGVQGKIGYINREVIVPVAPASGIALQDVVTLHWVPLSVGTRVKYRIGALPQIIPSLGISAGAQWIYQMGKLDGMSQGFWVPFYAISPSLILFEPQTDNQWFGGVSLGATFFNSFGSKQIVRGSSFDITATFIL